jgi:hypothetical protein
MRKLALLGAVVAAAIPVVAQSQPSADEPAPPSGVGSSYLDHAVISVRNLEKGLAEIVIHDLGRAKAEVPIAVTRADGKTTRCGVPLDVFLKGSRVARFRLPARPTIVRVELDPDHLYPDANRANDVWVRKR